MSNERVFESTRIISEDEVPPDIREKIRQMEARHPKSVANVVGEVDGQNVSALMSALRPNVIEKLDTKLNSRGAALAAQLVHAAKVGEEKRGERIRSKAKSIVESVNRSLKNSGDENVPV